MEVVAEFIEDTKRKGEEFIEDTKRNGEELKKNKENILFTKVKGIGNIR